MSGMLVDEANGKMHRETTEYMKVKEGRELAGGRQISKGRAQDEMRQMNNSDE